MATTHAHAVPERRDAGKAMPPLRRPPALSAGDRLTRPEFERRYLGMPGVNKAELIEGTVYMPSPVKIDEHGEPHTMIVMLLGTYSAYTPGVQAADNASVRLDLDNMPQPDALLRLRETHGGRTSRTEDGYLQGAPELVVEIANSSAAVDLRDKMHAYLRNGVREYLVWITYDAELRFFRAGADDRAGEFVRLEPADGVVRSEAFPGLWLDLPALARLDAAAQLKTLQQGLASPEHAAFVATLARASHHATPHVPHTPHTPTTPA